MKVVKIQIFVLIFISFKSADSDRLLAVQRFGAGYPSFHSIRMGNDGGLICANYKCKNPPHLCRIQSKSDQSRDYLMTTIDCIGPRMVISNRWSIRQQSPNNHKYIDILTEADVTGEISNTRNIEKGDEKFVDMFHQMEMPIDWNRLSQFDPFNANNPNPFVQPANPFMQVTGMSMKVSSVPSFPPFPTFPNMGK